MSTFDAKKLKSRLDCQTTTNSPISDLLIARNPSYLMELLDYLTAAKGCRPNPAVRPTWHSATISNAVSRLRHDAHGATAHQRHATCRGASPASRYCDPTLREGTIMSLFADNSQTIGRSLLVQLSRVVPEGTTILTKIEGKNPERGRTGARGTLDGNPRSTCLPLHPSHGRMRHVRNDDEHSVRLTNGTESGCAAIEYPL